MKKNYLFCLAALTMAAFSSCEKEEGEPTIPTESKTVGLYILNEGSMGADNSSIAYYDVVGKELTPDFYATQNAGKLLGNTANDLKIYGSKIYCVVNVSNKVVVLNAGDGKLLKEIDMGKEDTKNREPRYAATYGGKVYVSLYNGGVARIDTTSLTVEATTPISGTYPEGICVANNQLYVANSGYGSGKTVSVINISTFKESTTIETAVNPVQLKTSKSGDVYLTTLGNYTTIDAQLHRIDPKTNKVVHTFSGLVAGRVALYEDYAFTCHFSYVAYETYIQKVNLRTNEVTDFADVSLFRSVYGVDVNPLTGEVFYLDESGTVFCFNQEGVKQYQLDKVGERPNTVVFYTKEFPIK